jgi:hypothetical protein
LEKLTAAERSGVTEISLRSKSNALEPGWYEFENGS